MATSLAQLNATTEPLDIGLILPEEEVSKDFVLNDWLKSQSTNLMRHAAGLRPFKKGEFGTSVASPTEAHRQAVNRVISRLRHSLLQSSKQLTAIEHRAIQQPSRSNIDRFIRVKEQGALWTKATEKVWNFYFELFNQRQSRVADYLLSCDRIALDCYQAVYTGLGTARSIPSPAPFSYMETGFAPATIRRGVRFSGIGKRANPFPLIKLPYHRLINPWTLGAVPHEVAHNIQNDLGLWELLPKAIFKRLSSSGISPNVARIWARWHKEMFADMCGLLLTGPAFVSSLMDIVSRSTTRTATFNPAGVHPTPYLRVFINTELLRRTGFAREAEAYQRTWNKLYPRLLMRGFPAQFLKEFNRANRLVVDTMCFTPYPQLGNKPLAHVVCFKPKDQAIVKQAAGRLAAGTDPGIIPERFLIGAARFALDNRLARPGVITKNFYQALARR